MSTEVTPEAVGDFYDAKGGMLAGLMGGNIHYGYWDGPDDQASFAEAANRLTDHMIAELAPRPGERVLDLGCGRGRPAVRLAASADVEVEGISISEQDVAAANELAAQEGLAGRVHFSHADAMNLPFDDESFDVVWALESLLHMPDRSRILENVARVLKPGGQLILTDVFGSAPRDENEKAALDQVLRSWSINSLVDFDDYPALVSSAGLSFRKIIDVSERTRYSLPKLIALFRGSTESGGLNSITEPMSSWNQSFTGLVTMGYLILIADRPDHRAPAS